MIEYRWVWLTPVKFRFTNHFIWGFQKSHTGFWRYCKPLPGCKWTHVWTPKHVGRVWTWWQLYSIGNKQIHQWILGYPYTNHMFNEHSPLFWWNRPRLVDICSCKTPQPNMHRMDQDGMCRCIAHFLWNGGGFIVGRCWMQKLGLSEIFGNHNKLPIVYKTHVPQWNCQKILGYLVLHSCTTQRSAGNHVTWTQWVAIVAWNLWMGCHLVGSGRNAGGIIPIEQVENGQEIARMVCHPEIDHLNI